MREVKLYITPDTHCHWRSQWMGIFFWRLKETFDCLLAWDWQGDRCTRSDRPATHHRIIVGKPTERGSYPLNFDVLHCTLCWVILHQSFHLPISKPHVRRDFKLHPDLLSLKFIFWLIYRYSTKFRCRKKLWKSAIFVDIAFGVVFQCDI